MMLGIIAHALIVVSSFFFVFHHDLRWVNDNLHLKKLRGTGSGIEGCADNLPLFAVLFFVGSGECGADSIEHFFSRDTALFFKLVKYRMNYFKIEHSM